MFKIKIKYKLCLLVNIQGCDYNKDHLI